MDSEVPNLGKFAACRRVARTIYLGSAPTTAAAHRGLEDRRVKLGCVMPGESPAVFGDALRRLAGSATYLYQDGTRYWYSTQPTVTKLAEDRAEQLKRNPDKVIQEIEKRLREDLRSSGDFSHIHPMPNSGADVPDEMEARLVVLRSDQTYSKDSGNEAEKAARSILESRGTTPRIYRNTLVFLAADKARMQDLDEATRKFLAWESILAEKVQLNLDPHQLKQAETQRTAADSTVTARLPETYQWLLVPVQTTPQASVTWEVHRLSGQDKLAVRASKKLRNEELLIMVFDGTRLRMELNRIPLWRGDHVSVKQVVEDFARYPYLPRLKDMSVLIEAIRLGVERITWDENFAYASAYNEETNRYLGLVAGEMGTILVDSKSVLIKPDVAKKQLETTTPPGPPPPPPPPGGGGDGGGEPEPEPLPLQKRFHGTVQLDALRLARDAGKISEEIVQHFCALHGCNVEITLEIQAHIPDGASESLIRTVNENCCTLRFTNYGFEKD